ncbi:MAG TPA: hypothetical protein VHI71_07180 [Actinomycetota bacterium]|nr:hypothetical protein [Actinomycetota bacterium]
MRTEEEVREVLRLEAARHRVNPALPKKTAVKARTARALTVLGATGLAAGLVLGTATVVGAVRETDLPAVPASGGGTEASQRQVEGAPLLLVGHAGWRVSRADQYELDEGEMTFTNGERELELTWRPAASHDEYVEDRNVEAADSWDVEIANRHGRLFRYDGTTDFTALWVDGDLSLELRGVFPNVHAYRAVAETLGRVDEETWLAALPDDAVAPGERSAAVDEMLRDIPLHPDVQVAALKESSVVNERYQLGARVTGAVACAWIGQWLDAIAEGDEAAVREAVEAMATSRDWSILREMSAQGGWSEVLWEYADAMSGDGQVNAGPGEMSIEATYRDALGCGR